MKGKAHRFFTSFDTFGEPVSLNFKGDDTYRTAVGALFSIAIKLFIIVYAAQQLIKLAYYDDAKINNVSQQSFFERLSYYNLHMYK